ncbi:hypothetical protein M758_2G056500 [Ceratodon purpureus]|nr:hypothetical protein M758_2G056500 [Ceratodon purpureus]
MAFTSALASELKEMQLSDPCCTAGASMETEFHTALQPESERATSASSSFMTALGSERVVESGKCSRDVERDERIETSKVHWSEVSEAAVIPDGDGAVEEDNRKVFRALQSHRKWGVFFTTFGYSLGAPVPGRPGKVRGSSGELVMGDKFVSSGHAELFRARVNWRVPEDNEDDEKKGVEWVVKVFKKGTSLRQLQEQWPHGNLQHRGEMYSTPKNPIEIRYYCLVKYGVLLEDGRFAFLMVKEHEERGPFTKEEDGRFAFLMVKEHEGLLRKITPTYIGERGPFMKEEAELIMYRIAMGVQWLHEHNPLH